MEQDPNALLRKQQAGGNLYAASAPAFDGGTQIDAPFPRPLPATPGQQIDAPRPSPLPAAPAAPAAPPSLYESMQKRMATVQSGQPDPGNADLYAGMNQTDPNSLPTGAVDIGNGLVKFADGQTLPRNHPAFAIKVAALGQSAPAPAAPSGAAPLAPVAPPATIADSFKSALINKLNPTAPTLNDPALKAQTDAFHVGQERSRDAARRAMAERSAQEGGVGVNSGAFDQGLAGLFQKQGENEASFGANLLGDAQHQQDADLMQALGLGGQSVAQDKSLSLQDKLGTTDAAIRREGIASQADIARRDADIRSRQGDAGLNNQLLGLLLNNDQFGKQLGQNASQFGQSLDTNTILGLLGGL